MLEPLVWTNLKNLKGISLIDGVYLDKSLYLTSSQFFYDSGITPPTRRIKYMWIIVSTMFNLVSRDIDIKFFNSFKTIIELDSGICKYLNQYKNAFMLVLSKILRLKFADLFFRVKECMFISKDKMTLLSLRQEINEQKHTQKVLDTLPTLFTIVKLTFFNLLHFIKEIISSGSYFITKKNRYYKAPLKVSLTGFFVWVKNINHPRVYHTKKRLLKFAKNLIVRFYTKFTQVIKSNKFKFKHHYRYRLKDPIYPISKKSIFKSTRFSMRVLSTSSLKEV